MMKCGERVVNLERSFNIREGFSRDDDRVPMRMMDEPVPALGYGAIREEDMEKMIDDYYTARGWDRETGIPTLQKLEELGLVEVIEDLKRTRVIKVG
jgi:aldehyde:ferredoxin oxidoreductase